MTYTVTFYNLVEEREDFSVFQNLDDARDFVATRHEGYGKQFVITEESEDGQHKAAVE